MYIRHNLRSLLSRMFQDVGWGGRAAHVEPAEGFLPNGTDIGRDGTTGQVHAPKEGRHHFGPQILCTYTDTTQARGYHVSPLPTEDV